MGFAHLCDPEDALCCALVSVACRDAMHELYPSLMRQAGIHHRSAARNFRFSTPVVACVRSLARFHFARAIGMPWEPMDCLVASARIGAMDVCESLVREVQPPLPSDTEHAPAKVCRAAAFGGHVDVLQLVHSKGFRWDASCCAAAAQAGDLSTLRWLLRHGCPWDKATTSRAAIEGHTEVLNWARQHGCEYSEETILRMKMATLQLAMSSGVPSTSVSSLTTTSNEQVVDDDSGVAMVSRHAPCWPPGWEEGRET